MIKIVAFAVVAANLVVTSPASAQPHHKVVAHRGHNDAVVVDRSGFHAFALAPRGSAGAGSYDPAVTGGGSAGYNAALHNDF